MDPPRPDPAPAPARSQTVFAHLGRILRLALPFRNVFVAYVVVGLLYQAVTLSFAGVGKIALDAIGLDIAPKARAAADDGRPTADRRPPADPSPPRPLASPAPPSPADRFFTWVRGLLGLTGPADGNLFARLGLLVFLVGAVHSVLGYLRSNLEGWLAVRVLVCVRNHACARFLEKPLSFFQAGRTGDLLSRLSNDLNYVRLAGKAVFEDFLQVPAALLLCLVLALGLSWRLTILFFLFLPLLFLVVRRLGKRIRKKSRESLEHMGDILDLTQQMFSGIRVVHAFGLEERQVREFEAKNEEFFEANYKMVRQKAKMKALLEFGSAGLPFLLVVAIFYAIQAGLLDVAFSTFVAFLYLPHRAYSLVKRLANCWGDLQEAMAGMDRVFGLIEETARREDAPEAVPLPGVGERVAFREVTFAYDGAPPVLRGISFEARIGEVIAVMGRTGAGKSTLLDLVPRFHDPQGGAVEVDGKDIRSFTRRSLLDRVAVVTQEPFLFNTTIRENIRMGRPSAGDAEVAAAAKAACVEPFLAQVPGGLDYVVGERGGRLSGGQRQRVTLARAFLKDAPIVILDEPTSALDPESEGLIQAAIRNLMKDRLTFVITHRPATVRAATRILVLEDGRIKMAGTPEELLRHSDPYFRMIYKEQVGEELGGPP